MRQHQNAHTKTWDDTHVISSTPSRNTLKAPMRRYVQLDGIVRGTEGEREGDTEAEAEADGEGEGEGRGEDDSDRPGVRKS